MTLEDFKDAYQDAPSLKKLSLLMETLSRRADAQAFSATERWNENWEAEQHWTNEMRVASAKARWLHEELANVLIAKDKQIHDLQQRQLAELKAAQEPGVMTATEAYTADYVYIEFDGVITPAIRTTNERDGHRESYFATQQLGGDWMRWDDYGITWRCWTSRPTDKQRKEVAWNE